MPDSVTPVTDDAATLKRRSVQGAAATFVSQGLRFLLQFGSQVALARLLMPSQFGLVAMLGPVLAFVGIFNELGLSQATIQRASISRQELSNLFWINVAVSTALAGLMCLAAPAIAAFYNEPLLVPIALALASLLVLGGLTAQQIALLNRNMRFMALATIDVSSTAMATIVGIAAALLGMGYWSLVLMQAVNSLTILLMAWGLCRYWPGLPRRGAGTLSLLRFGSHMTGFNLINFASTNMDSILIGKLGGSVQLGLYDRGFKLITAPMWTISMPIARVADSLLARLQNAPERYRRAHLLMLQLLQLVTLPAAAFIAATAGTLVPFLMGSQWTAAAPIVAGLAVANFFGSLGLGASWLFVSQHRAAEQSRYAIYRTGVVILSLAIGLHWGAAGVAWSYAAFGILTSGLPIWGATRRGPVRLADVLRASVPTMTGAIVAYVVVLVLASRLGAMPTLPRMALCGLASYAACAATLCCFPHGIGLLRDMWTLRSSFRGGGAPAAVQPSKV